MCMLSYFRCYDWRKLPGLPVKNKKIKNKNVSERGGCVSSVQTIGLTFFWLFFAPGKKKITKEVEKRQGSRVELRMNSLNLTSRRSHHTETLISAPAGSSFLKCRAFAGSLWGPTEFSCVTWSASFQCRVHTDLMCTHWFLWLKIKHLLIGLFFSSRNFLMKFVFASRTTEKTDCGFMFPPSLINLNVIYNFTTEQLTTHHFKFMILFFNNLLIFE